MLSTLLHLGGNEPSGTGTPSCREPFPEQRCSANFLWTSQLGAGCTGDRRTYGALASRRSSQTASQALCLCPKRQCSRCGEKLCPDFTTSLSSIFQASTLISKSSIDRATDQTAGHSSQRPSCLFRLWKTHFHVCGEADLAGGQATGQ